MSSNIANNTLCPRLWAEIDLDAIVHNYSVIRSRIGSGVRLMAMVKSNAYGHGAVQVARVLQDAGADCFGVANVEEAVELRAAGITSPILITGPITPCEIETAVANHIQMTATPPEIIHAIEAEAVRQQQTARLHLMLDIGMTRCGLSLETAAALAAHIKAAAPALELAAVAAHFPMAEDTEVSRKHLECFTATCNHLRKLDLLPPVRHAANTMAVFNLPEAHFEMVRPGIGLYGLYPDDSLRSVPLKPVMSVRTQVAYVRPVRRGTAIGYGQTYRTAEDTVIATLPVGYADGFRRILSNRGRVIIAGQYANVVGCVSMDMITVDAGRIPNVRAGMPVTIIGREGDAEITAEEHAELCNTILYEIVCLIGKRVDRMFKLNGRDVSLDSQIFTRSGLTPSQLLGNQPRRMKVSSESQDRLQG